MAELEAAAEGSNGSRGRGGGHAGGATTLKQQQRQQQEAWRGPELGDMSLLPVATVQTVTLQAQVPLPHPPSRPAQAVML